MYSMVMMMAVASSGDVASFGGRDKGCCGGEARAGLFSKRDNGGCCGGGAGLFGGLKDRFGGHKAKKHSCSGGGCTGYVPAIPAPCGGCDVPAPCGTVEAPCATPGAPIVTPHATEAPKTMPAPVETPKTTTQPKKES